MIRALRCNVLGLFMPQEDDWNLISTIEGGLKIKRVTFNYAPPQEFEIPREASQMSSSTHSDSDVEFGSTDDEVPVLLRSRIRYQKGSDPTQLYDSKNAKREGSTILAGVQTMGPGKVVVVFVVALTFSCMCFFLVTENGFMLCEWGAHAHVLCFTPFCLWTGSCRRLHIPCTLEYPSESNSL